MVDRAPADDVVLERADGSTLRAGSLWQDRSCLLVFLRHFACPSCSVRLERTLPRAAELDRLGVRVVLVGCGSPAALARFEARLHIEATRVTLVVSPDAALYRAFGMVRSGMGTFGPRAALGAAWLYATGHYAARRDDDGDVLQQGGAVLVAPDGSVVHRRVEQSLVDAYDPSEAVGEVLRRVAAEAGV
jgi:peroxiredoxin